MREIKSTITAVGPQALEDQDPMVILFDETASETLRQVAVIQQFDDETAQQQLELHAGDELVIDDQHLPIDAVGSLVNENLQTIGHVTLVFSDAGPADLHNAIYFRGQPKPNFRVGTQLIYRLK